MTTKEKRTSVYDKYDGKKVSVQLKTEYFAGLLPHETFTNPDGSHARVPLIVGIAEVLVDDQMTRVNIKGRTPDGYALDIVVHPDQIQFLNYVEVE